MAYSLMLLNGVKTGFTLSLHAESSEVTIGRHISNDLQLDDNRASRMHARITQRGGRWHLDDCGSLNGTHVNSQPVNQTVLESGDLIRIGDRLILFVEDRASRAHTDIKTSVFRATTAVGKRLQPDSRSALVEESVSESMGRIVRESAVLCQLANLLHQHTETEVLLKAAVDALFDGVDADSVAIWLVGADGRLRCGGRRGEKHDEHLLASLSVEKSKAILLEDASKTDDSSVTSQPTIEGRALAVPIPSGQRCRGAIECHTALGSKPFSREDLDFAVVVAHQAGLALENLEHRERLELANAELRRRVASQTNLVGSSPAMQRVLDQISRIGPASSNVLVLGESGTGKELVARSIHDVSRYSAGPYVTVNCAAFTESLLESELFGHEVGAFTGADRRYLGRFERAHRGTLFLDEIGEMSLSCQAKLLRVLEGHPFQRLGSEEAIVVDVRVIAATHRNLLELIEQKRFREDLYYRLRVIDIVVPPLRDRGDDVIELASRMIEHFRSQMGRGPRRLSKGVMAALKSYGWPGNVRELKNAVERAVVLGQEDEVLASDLGLPVSQDTSVSQARPLTLKDAERRHIKHVLALVDGNKTQACRILGIGRATLYSKIGEISDDSDGR